MSCSNQQQKRKKPKYFKCLSGVWIKSLIFMSFLRGPGRIACLHPSFPAGKQTQSDCKHIEVKHSPRRTGKGLTNTTWQQLVPRAGTRWQQNLTAVSKHSHVLREESGWSLLQLTLIICNKTPSWQHTSNTFLLNESLTLSLELFNLTQLL